MSSFENLPEQEKNLDRQTTKSKEHTPGLVWIIDDNEEFAMALSRALFGLRSKIFPDGEAAIAEADVMSHLSESIPAAILVDGDLGEGKLTGPEIIRALCGLGVGKETETTFVTLSGDPRANDAMEKEARAHGAPVVVYKKGGGLKELKEILRDA